MNRTAMLVLALLCSPALADDGPAPAKPPAVPEKPAAPPPVARAKKERKTSAAGDAAFAKYAGLLHFPSNRYKKLVMDSHADVVMAGGEVGCKFTIENGEVSIDIALPEQLRKQYGEAETADLKKVAGSWVGGYFKPFVVPADQMMKQYDVSAKEVDGRTIVEIERFADGAAWDRATMWFNAEGLLEKQVGVPNVDPNDRLAAADAGADIEMTFEYKKRGERYTIESAKIVKPMGETTVKFAYFEIEGQPPFPKELAVNSPMFGEMVIAIHDFVLDGKAVAGTERKEEKKPEPAPPAAKKEDGAKPAEPPKK